MVDYSLSSSRIHDHLRLLASRLNLLFLISCLPHACIGPSLTNSTRTTLLYSCTSTTCMPSLPPSAPRHPILTFHSKSTSSTPSIVTQAIFSHCPLNTRFSPCRTHPAIAISPPSSPPNRNPLLHATQPLNPTTSTESPAENANEPTDTATPLLQTVYTATMSTVSPS